MSKVMTAESKGTPKPAIRIVSEKPNDRLYLTGNRAGYAALREIFAKLAEAPPAAFPPGSDAAHELAVALDEHVVPTSRYSLFECSLDESLRHEPRARFSRALWLYDRLGLVGCATLLVGAGLVAGILARGVVALWQDLP